MRDPLNQRRYAMARRAWLAGYRGEAGTCVLCGMACSTTLPGTHPLGPTIEHLIPVRWIMANARTDAEALAWALDTTRWALAHKHCQSRQGGASSVERAPRAVAVGYTPSRDW